MFWFGFFFIKKIDCQYYLNPTDCKYNIQFHDLMFVAVVLIANILTLKIGVPTRVNWRRRTATVRATKSVKIPTTQFIANHRAIPLTANRASILLLTSKNHPLIKKGSLYLSRLQLLTSTNEKMSIASGCNT